MTRTKIVATLGPASESEESLKAMLAAGLDVARINFSHGTHEDHSRRLQRFRAAAGGRPAAVLGDLCGPKIRVSALPGSGLSLVEGQELVVHRRATGGLAAGAIVTSYPGVVDDGDVGHRLLIDDGAVRCRIVEKRPDLLRCRCEVGGLVLPRKGVNLPDSQLKLSSLTEKDLADLDWALAQGLDYIGLSFVRSAADVDALRRHIEARGGAARIVSKIETPAAVRDIDAIIARSDAILVARGDLGVEMDLVDLPLIQKDVVRRCRAAGVPVIVATQMLQSMTESPTPTRAEVSDVANAILDGADAVMLSAESAVGKHPLAAVDFMNRIVARTEAAGDADRSPCPRVEQPSSKVTSAVARTAAAAAREHAAKAVVVWTRSGNTARLLSKHHLDQPILACSPADQVCRQMALFAGVTPVKVERPADEPAMIRAVDRELLRRGWAKPADMVVIVAGTNVTTAGASNAVILHFVDDA